MESRSDDHKVHGSVDTCKIIVRNLNVIIVVFSIVDGIRCMRTDTPSFFLVDYRHVAKVPGLWYLMVITIALIGIKGIADNSFRLMYVHGSCVLVTFWSAMFFWHRHWARQQLLSGKMIIVAMVTSPLLLLLSSLSLALAITMHYDHLRREATREGYRKINQWRGKVAQSMKSKMAPEKKDDKMPLIEKTR
ncbi:hypothetical protein HDE_06102 [Halotydeus destructor]|nr:hypothetical protein HDE_06102 [Halotydeus destructor]